jgi:glycosyltransferase involved in cell wall biosynthesis
MRGVAVPCKTYGIMAAARPVLFVGDPDADPGRQVRAGEAGYVIEPRDADALVNAIRELADDPEHARRLGRNGRAYFQRHHERAVCCRAWTDLLEGLGRKRHAADAVDNADAATSRADRAATST